MDVLKVIIFDPIFNILIFFYNLVGDMGLAIILLTLLVKVLLLPLANRALRAQRRLQALAPELKKIQEKHKGNREALQREMLKFYRAEGVNPTSSCLPTLLQIPILIALFFVFKDAVAGIHLDSLYSFVHRPGNIDPSFLGLIDLSKPPRESLALLLPATTAGLQFWQSKMLLPKNGPAPAMNRQIIYLFPILTFIIATTLPAALPLYWATSTLFTVAQQYIVMKEMPMAEAKAEGITDWNKANPADPISRKGSPGKSRRGQKTQVTVRKRGE